MSKKIIVFGATGEIGGRIARLATDLGYDVIGISRGTNRRPVVDLSGIKMIAGDKGDTDFIKNVCVELKANVVIDSVPQIEHIKLFHQYLNGVKNFLFCSSVGTYAPLVYMPADENHPWQQKTKRNFYQQCIRDTHILDLWKHDGFPATILRPSEILGADRVPIELWGARNIEFFKKLKANKPVTIAECEDILIHPVYNWDVAQAFISALEYPDKIRGKIYNIAGKHAITLGRYLEFMKEYFNSSSKVIHLSREQMEKKSYVSKKDFKFLLTHDCIDITRARNTFGYDPIPVEKSLVEALQWCEKTGLL